MNPGLTIGSTTKKLNAQTPASAASMNGNGLAISTRRDDSARQPHESAIPSVTASAIWTVTPMAAGAAGNNAFTPAAVVTPRATVAASVPVAPAYTVTNATSARPPAAPATTPWRIVSSNMSRLSLISSNIFGNLPPYGPIIA